MRKTAGNLFKIIGLILCSTNLSWATVTACGVGAANKTALSTYGTASLGNGCSAVDLSFENFLITSTTNTGGFGTPATSTTSGYASGATTTSGNTVGAVNFLLTPTTPSDWVGSNGNAQFVAQFNYVAIAHSTGGYPAPSAGAWYFDSLQLLSGPIFTPSNVLNTISFTQTYCLGATTTVGCAAANLAIVKASYTGDGVLVSSSLSCGASFVSCTGGLADISNSLRFSTVAVTTDVNANRATGSGAGGSITIGDFGTSFAQFAATPEPSTFGLMGAALAGLGLLSRRRKSS
jgi:hypothetical protein